VSATELSDWLKPIGTKTIIVNCASASGPFINALKSDNRILITATKSGFQYNFARFGEYFSAALSDKTIDLDKDGAISLLEAFLAASNRTAEFYKSDARLATENALLEDNGDGKGTSVDWFTGIRVTKKAQAGSVPDGARANQIILNASESDSKLSDAAKKQRDELEIELEKIRARKTFLTETDYYQQLESVLLKLARLYHPSNVSDK
jgi:hypothetical protein